MVLRAVIGIYPYVSRRSSPSTEIIHHLPTLCKQGFIRNYCAHNYFLKSQGISAEEFLFCIYMLYLAMRTNDDIELSAVAGVEKEWNDQVKKALFLMSGQDNSASDDYEADLKEQLYAFLKTHTTIKKDSSAAVRKANQNLRKALEKERSAGVTEAVGEDVKTPDEIINDWSVKLLFQYMGYINFHDDAPPKYYIFSIFLYIRNSLRESASADCSFTRLPREIEQYVENKIGSIFQSVLSQQDVFEDV